MRIKYSLKSYGFSVTAHYTAQWRKYKFFGPGTVKMSGTFVWLAGPFLMVVVQPIFVDHGTFSSVSAAFRYVPAYVTFTIDYACK